MDVLARPVARATAPAHRAHWKAIRFLREDFAVEGETPAIRRVSIAGGIPVKELFTLFPQKPAKKMAYIAGAAQAERLCLTTERPDTWQDNGKRRP